MKRKMKQKIMIASFLILNMTSFAANNVKNVDKEVKGQNEQKLELDSEKSSGINVSDKGIKDESIKDSIKGFKKESQGLEVNRQESGILEDELSKGLDNNSSMWYIFGAIGAIALIAITVM